MYRQSLVAALLSLCVVPAATAEITPSSTLERTQCKFQDQTDVTIEYGSMQMNGRKIFGGLVPYGKTWKMGSTRSPTFVTSANLVIGGKEVAAGHYSLVTVPDPDKWTMIVEKLTSKGSQDQTEEVARIDLTVRPLRSALENFTISFDQLRGGCLLNMRWEQTEASVLLAGKK